LEKDPSTTIELKIPCMAEYASVARRAILGVANRMRFSYDEVEDIRLAVGEACASIIARASKRYDPPGVIELRCQIEESKLTLEISQTGGEEVEKSETQEPEEPSEGQGLGPLLTGLLVDELETETTPEGRMRIRMVKYIER